MPAVAPILSIVGTVVGAVGAIKQAKAAKKSAAAQAQSVRLQQRAASRAAARERIEAFRNMRIQAAQARSYAAAGGVAQSSTAQIGMPGSLVTPTAGGVGFSQGQQTLGEQASAKMAESAIYGAKASYNPYGAISGIFSGLASRASQSKSGSIFG